MNAAKIFTLTCATKDISDSDLSKVKLASKKWLWYPLLMTSNLLFVMNLKVTYRDSILFLHSSRGIVQIRESLGNLKGRQH